MAKTQEPGITKIEGVKSTYYRVQIRIKNGEHLSQNFDNFKDAKDWKRKNTAAVKAGDHYETTQMRRLTVGDLINRFIEGELKKLRNHKTMLGHLNWFKQEIGHISLSRFREDVVAKCRDKLASTPDKRGRSRSPATVNRYLCTLGSVVRLAISEWKLLTSSPLKHVRKLAEPRGRTRHLSKEERGRLLKACKESPCPHLYPITWMALLTGMRRGEILGLRWRDINFRKDETVFITREGNPIFRTHFYKILKNASMEADLGFIATFKMIQWSIVAERIKKDKSPQKIMEELKLKRIPTKLELA